MGDDGSQVESRSDVRVVLVKPGDVLVIGNLGPGFVPELLSEATKMMKAATGISILACYQDVSIGVLDERLTELLDYCDLHPSHHPAYGEVADRLRKMLS